MPRSGYDLSNIPEEERPGRREGTQGVQATDQPTRSPATSASPAPASLNTTTSPSTSQAQAQEAPTVRVSPGYVTNAGEYAAYNSRTGRGWLAGSSRAAPGSSSSVLAGEAARAASYRPIAPAPAPAPTAAMAQDLVPAPLFSSPRSPGPSRLAGAPQAPTRGGLLAPPPPRTFRQRGGGTSGQQVRRRPNTTISVSSAAATTIPALVVTAPPSSSSSSSDEEMTDAGDADASKGKGKQKM
ncbi:hypothetical protein F5X99DRAFT_302202 [Biscogniauxia marginata]|nr:hypothetical protein F5X99DRAFT_302202 [Biscogniauxia marginata]